MTATRRPGRRWRSRSGTCSPSGAYSPERTHAIDPADEALCHKPRTEWQRLDLDWEELPPGEQCSACREVVYGA